MIDDVREATIEQFCTRHAIETVDCVFPDMWGVLRGKRVPVRWLLDNEAHGFTLAALAFSWDVRSEVVPSSLVPSEREYPDIRVVPDATSIRLAPWSPGLAICFCDTYFANDDAPVPVDGRRLVRRSVEQVRGQGFEPIVACELEFHLCTPDWRPAFDGVHCYSIAKTAEVGAALDDMSRMLERCGVDVEGVIVEYGPGQVELNVGRGSALELADTTAFFKHLVKSVARTHGLRATFMAKPFQNELDNALHVHQSLLDEHGDNVFAHEDLDDGPIRSTPMRKWLAGLLEHHLDLATICFPTVNSYREIGYPGPRVTWGLANRSAAIRALVGIGGGTRLECKRASADANPHLAIAGFLAAGASGLASEPPAPFPTSADESSDLAAFPHLPGSLDAAIDILEQSTFAREALGDIFVETFCALGRHETRSLAEQVTEWELERYRDVL